MTVCEIVPPATRKELIPAIPRCVRPWEINRYALLNWWDMERFAADRFVTIATQLAILKESSLRDQQSGNDSLLHPPSTRIFLDALSVIESECEKIGLRISVCAVQMVVRRMKMPTTVFSSLTGDFEQIANSILWEMQATQFFYMPPDQADFYDQKELFGTEVNAKFPSIQFDMVEAGNCYAMGRGTACVFHLMRIMEVGTQELGKRLGVANVHEKNWQNILDEVNKKIKALPSKGADTVALSEAAAHLYSVKLAWRNEVMHPNDKYTLEEAKDLIQHVRLFMRKLAYII